MAKKKTSRTKRTPKETPGAPLQQSSLPFVDNPFTEKIKAMGKEVSRRSERVNNVYIHHYIKHENGQEHLEIEHKEILSEE